MADDDYSGFSIAEPVEETPPTEQTTVALESAPSSEGYRPAPFMGVSSAGWEKVMEGEGAEPDPTPGREFGSMYGASSSRYWPGRSQLEDAAYDALHQYGPRSRQGIEALQRFWQSQAQGVDISGVKSEGLKMMMLSDIQHQGGKAMLAATGDPLAYNNLSEADAINLYAQRRRSLWTTQHASRLEQEQQWASSRLGGGDYSSFSTGEKDDYSSFSTPETKDTTGVADFFLKRGDQPITNSNDPRLTTVTVGGQSWQVNKEAAPSFQGFLSDLARAGAPVQSAGGWVYRNIAGTNKLSEHAWGGAIDVNQTGRDEVTPAFRNWIAQNPGKLQQLENKWNIYGGERFGDLGHFEWGGVAQEPAAKAETKKDDYSAFSTPENVPRGTKKDETPPSRNPFTDFWNNLFGTAGQAGFGLDVAKAKEDLNRAKSGEVKPTLFGAAQEKEDQELKNPNISQADAQEIIARRRARTEMDQKIAELQLKRAEVEQAKAKAITPGPEYQRTIPGTISTFLGQSAPYLLSGSLGAAAPAAMATQMSEQAYGDTFDRATKQGRQAHPEWSEEQLRQNADKTARAAAQTGFENGVVMGLLPVPKVGPLVARLVQRLGMRGTYMAVAGASQDIEENIQIKKGVDQNQSIYEGVLKHVPANLIAGAVFEAPGAITEAVRAREGTPERAVPRDQPPAPLPKPQQAPPEPKPVEQQPTTTEADQWVSAIANRYTQERAARGEIGEVAPGQGYATTDLVNRGLAMKPEEINQHVSDLMHNTGDPLLQAAAVRAEEARLSERSSRLSRISEDNPADAQAKINADNAFNDLTDFHNGPVAKLKNNWHAQGMTLQGEVPVPDLGSFNGLREAWLRDVGTTPSPEVESKMRDTAKRVREAQAAENLALRNVGEEAVKSSLERRLARAEEVKRNIMERLKDDPCL